MRAAAEPGAERVQEGRAQRSRQVVQRQLRGDPAWIGVGEHNRVRGESDYACVAAGWLSQDLYGAVRGREVSSNT